MHEAEREFRLYHGDARGVSELLERVLLPEERVTLTITSPPYGWLKDYGGESQIGHGQSLAEYLEDCGKIFRRIADRTRKEGSLWLVVDTIVDQSSNPSTLVPLPFLLADAAARGGWSLRDVLVWRRDRGLPWSGRGRMRNEFEYILHLVLSDSFVYNLAALREPSGTRWWVRFPERYNPGGMAPSNVWDLAIPTQGAWPNASPRHSCPFPGELARRIIALASAPGDIVLDPFAGVGSVVAEATVMGRRGLGIEMVPELVDGYASVLNSAEQAARPGGDSLPGDESSGIPSAADIMYLRALKYARVLSETLGRADASKIGLAAVVPGEPRVDAAGVWRADAKVWLFLQDPQSEPDLALALATEAGSRRPLSKFGVDAKIHIVGRDAIQGWVERFPRVWWHSPNGRFWKSGGAVGPLTADVIERLVSGAGARVNLLGTREMNLVP